MVKKKQGDFQKTKLRVGKQLPKGKNVTDTSFKTRKIITRDQLKAIPGDVSLKELLNYLGHNNVTRKKETLQKLNTFILEKKETLSLFFPDIMNRVGGILREDDGSIREIAIVVLDTCFKLMTSVQFRCFFTILTSNLNGMMTHHDRWIRKDSLKLLDKILSSHPDVICHSVGIMNNLLNLISSVVPERSATPDNKKKRKLNELICSSITSQEWRVDVLTRIYIFLLNALGKVGMIENEDQDELEVHWDGEKPLYLPLYLRGGTSPVKLELLYRSSSLESTKSLEFKDFIYELVPLLSDILKGEIPMKQNQSYSVVEPSVIKHLNIVAHVLCCLGEWVYKMSASEKDKIDPEFYQLVSNVICRQLLKGFPYTQHDSSFIKMQSGHKDETECMELNLAVCYLYCMFLLDTTPASYEIEKATITYLDDVFRICSKMCNKSIALMLKISEICMRSKNINPTYKNGILLGLYGILEVHKFSPCAKSIYSFFMEVSLNYEFKYLLNSEGMTTWFNLILKEMVFMMESGAINKNFLKYVRYINTRQYSSFMELLNKAKHADLLNLLKCKDEEFQLTVINLICSLNHIPSDFFQDLAEMIGDPLFSLKTAHRCIHLLHARLSRPDIKIKDKIAFLQFLLNLGCDSAILIEPSWETSEKPSDMLVDVMQSCHFELHPSSKWERHMKIAEVCFDCLPTYMRIGMLTQCTVLFIKSIMLEHTKLPIHCAISLLKLRKQVEYIYQDEDLGTFFSELIFSSLMYLSVMRSNNSTEGLESYAISELQNSLYLKRNDVPEIISIINNNIYNFGESELYHALRMTLFLIHTNVLQIDDRNPFYCVLEKINSTCQRSKLLHPLWLAICKFFHFI